MLNLSIAEVLRLQNLASAAEGWGTSTFLFYPQKSGGFWRDPWGIYPLVEPNGDTHWQFTWSDRGRQPYATFNCFRDAALHYFGRAHLFNRFMAFEALVSGLGIDIQHIGDSILRFGTAELNLEEPVTLRSRSVVVASLEGPMAAETYGRPEAFHEWQVGPLDERVYPNLVIMERPGPWVGGRAYNLFAIDILEQIYSPHSTPYDE